MKNSSIIILLCISAHVHCMDDSMQIDSNGTLEVTHTIQAHSLQTPEIIREIHCLIEQINKKIEIVSLKSYQKIYLGNFLRHVHEQITQIQNLPQYDQPQELSRLSFPRDQLKQLCSLLSEYNGVDDLTDQINSLSLHYN